METINTQNPSNDIIGFDISFHSMIYPIPHKLPTVYLQLEREYCENTCIMSSLIWHEVIIGLNAVFLTTFHVH